MYYIRTFIINSLVIKKFIFPLVIIALLVSCNSTAPLVEVGSVLNERNITAQNISIEEKIEFINSYITKIDFKANDTNNFNLSELIIQGDQRNITENESKKDILLKNNNIVRVKYYDHLYNNFIKSKIFYYNKNELVCIKVIEILPDQSNNVGVAQRTIYVVENQPISDTNVSGMIDEDSTILVALGQNSLKNEYNALN